MADTTQNTPAPDLIPIWPACERLGIGRDLAYRLAKKDELPVRVARIGNCYRISRIALDRVVTDLAKTENTTNG